MILGDANCGKTSLVTRFAQGYYHPNLNHRSKSVPNSPNTGAHTNAASSVLSPASSSVLAQHRNPNFVTKSIPVTASNIPTKIQIWDVACSIPNNNNTTTAKSGSAKSDSENNEAEEANNNSSRKAEEPEEEKPLTDEELARRMHVEMNASPRLGRNGGRNRGMSLLGNF